MSGRVLHNNLTRRLFKSERYFQFNRFVLTFPRREARIGAAHATPFQFAFDKDSQESKNDVAFDPPRQARRLILAEESRYIASSISHNSVVQQYSQMGNPVIDRDRR